MADSGQIIAAFSAWLDWPTKLAVPAIALAGAVYTGLQYRRVKDWRSGDLAAQLIADLTKEEELTFACQTLDWGVGPLIVSTKYRRLLVRKPENADAPTPIELGEVIIHTPEILLKAIEINLAFDYRVNPEGLFFRYCFDRLFSHLANVHRLLITGQIKKIDLGPRIYWLEKLGRYPYGYGIKPPNEIFQPYIRYPDFGYVGIVELAKQLDVASWKEEPANLKEIWASRSHRGPGLRKLPETLK